MYVSRYTICGESIGGNEESVYHVESSVIVSSTTSQKLDKVPIRGISGTGTALQSPTSSVHVSSSIFLDCKTVSIY